MSKCNRAHGVEEQRCSKYSHTGHCAKYEEGKCPKMHIDSEEDKYNYEIRFNKS